MLKRSYKFLRGLIRCFSPRMKTIWQEPHTGEPSVFICNHAGAFGPIDICVKFPLRDLCRPWMNAQVLDAKQVPAYVRQDYWWKPGCRLEPLYNATLPYMAAAVLPPILRTAPTIPVYHDIQVVKTFRQSLQAIKKGEHLVIFPEQPSGYQSHHMTLNRGFLQIAPMVYRATGQALPFYPVKIDYKHHRFLVSRPVRFDPTRTLDEQADELMDALAVGIRQSFESEEA